jgi:hypothetical protein
VNAARPAKPKRNAGRGGRRPAGRPGGAAGRPGGRPRDTWARQPGVRITGGAPDVPVDRTRARLILAGLLTFTLGFAVAAALVVAGLTATPGHVAAVVVGVVGIVVVGVAYARRTTPMPATPIWSRNTLTVLSDAAGWPAVPVMVAVYGLGVLGVLGNIGYPLAFGTG